MEAVIGLIIIGALLGIGFRFPLVTLSVIVGLAILGSI